MPRPCAVEFHARGYEIRLNGFGDATALRRGASRLLLKLNGKFTESIERESPRRKGVASQRELRLFYSRDRETPRHKAVASQEPFRRIL